MRNQPQLITYVDRFAGDLPTLHALLRAELADVFGGVHLLPFFDPIDGADAGFDPVDHRSVDIRLGVWDDVAAIADEFDVMADLIVNHMSTASEQFIDWSARGSESKFNGMFLTYDAVFPDGATETELTTIYRPRPGLPFSVKMVAGRPRVVWTTFTSEQVDLDVEHPRAWNYLIGVLDVFARGGVNLVRLDAVGYAVKRSNTASFMIPETFDFIERLGTECRNRGMQMLVEIHAHHQSQIEIASRVDMVYDFALPPLVLHAIYQADSDPLRRWLGKRPVNCVTVLDTHDGIGVIDVAPEADRRGLLDERQVDSLVERIHLESGGSSRAATGESASNLDLYQVNCTFFDALGGHDDAYMLARLVQILVPGVPQIYYAGLLAAHNDLDLLESTGVGRDINRPIVAARIGPMLERPIVGQLLHLLRWRTANHALFDGEFSLLASCSTELRLAWSSPRQRLDARLDFEACEWELVVSAAGSTQSITRVEDLDTRAPADPI